MSGQRACVIFNKLVAMSIEDASGIFIGTNQAIGWSSVSKRNEGFGSLSNAVVTRSVSIVYDPDVADAKVDEVRNISVTESPGALRQSAVDFASIHADVVNNGSAIDLGDITQPGWRSSRKVNTGGSRAVGGNVLSRLVEITLDNDHQDAVFHTEGLVQDTSTVRKNMRIVQNPRE